MTKKQERARAKRRWQRRQASQAARAARRARLVRVGAVVAAVLVVAGLVVWVAARQRDAGAAEAASSTSPSPSVSLAKGCTMPPEPLGTGAELTLPDKKTAAGRTWLATVTTTCGDIEMELDGAKAPQAVASFIQLARSDYWLDSPCHRLVTQPQMTVLQCGDPTGTGSGEPGYGFAVENAPADRVYPRGVVAMARTPDAEQGNGGQFFIVAQPSTIPDEHGYTVFGRVTKGLDIVDSIVAAGVAPGSATPDDGAPKAPISILRVAVTEKKA